MSQNDIIKLTLAVYQVTGFFPENEPLKSQIREKANHILADFVSANPKMLDKQGFLKEIDVLLAYFSVAKEQNWLNSKNFSVLTREYRKIEHNFPKNSPKQAKIAQETEILTPKKRESVNKSLSTPSSRQKKIVEMTKNKGQVSSLELRNVFSQVTPRTLRRDLSALLKNGMIEKIRNGKEDISFVLK